MKAQLLAVASLGILLGSGCSSTNDAASDAGTCGPTEGGGGGADGGTGADGSVADAGADVEGGASNPLGFTPSNFDPGQLDLTDLPDVDVTQGCTPIDSANGLFGCGVNPKFKVITQPDQIKVGVYAARSWRIEPNVVLQVTGPYPLILVATDKIEILGGLTATAPFGGGAVAGGYATPNMSFTAGLGPGGGGAGSLVNTGPDGSGAGGGSYCGIGGSGGASSATAALGGMAYGTPEIVPLVGGSAGGEGAGSQPGGGGGAIQLVAGNSVTVDAMAYVSAGGGGGLGGQQAAGGGSGGSVLIEASSVTIAGTLAANGGGGGQGGGTQRYGAPGSASNMAAPGGTDTSNASTGGNGSAATTENGGAGNATPMMGEGGGGGGAGRIRINTRSGKATLTGATLSPDATTACVTQGMLK